ncbi:hypothetical protein KAI52_03610 [Candidatus Parcubacteria bacterium]|nr:hypothetical protein [Candidatus Parcubacteria bacterium]
MVSDKIFWRIIFSIIILASGLIGWQSGSFINFLLSLAGLSGSFLFLSIVFLSSVLFVTIRKGDKEAEVG